MLSLSLVPMQLLLKFMLFAQLEESLFIYWLWLGALRVPTFSAWVRRRCENGEPSPDDDLREGRSGLGGREAVETTIARRRRPTDQKTLHRRRAEGCGRDSDGTGLILFLHSGKSLVIAVDWAIASYSLFFIAGVVGYLFFGCWEIPFMIDYRSQELEVEVCTSATGVEFVNEQGTALLVEGEQKRDCGHDHDLLSMI